MFLLKKKIHIGYAAIENSLNSRRTRIRNRYNQCFRLPMVPSWATKASKTLFLTIFGIRSSKILTLSIAAYPVWIRCTLHDVTVDIFTYNWIKLFETVSKESIEQWRYNILFRKLTFYEAVRAGTHYHTRAWQTLIYEKECFILLLLIIKQCNNSD